MCAYFDGQAQLHFEKTCFARIEVEKGSIRDSKAKQISQLDFVE